MIALRRMTVVAIYLVMMVIGIRSILYADQNRVDYVISMIVCLLMTQFCVLDAKIIGMSVVRSFYWLIIFAWPVSVPLYLLWSRGGKGLMWAIVHAVGIMAVAGTAAAMTELVVPKSMIENPVLRNE